MMKERNAGTVDGGFTPVSSGARWVCTGALTFADAADVLAATQAMALPRDGVVDCAGIVVADSAAVAVLLALKRRAAAEGSALAFANLPAQLSALAAVYGVDTILAA
jgi:phospholipid transport system transporter-binding protein